MSYEWRAERANDYDYPQIGGHSPDSNGSDYIVFLVAENERMRQEVADLKAVIRELERESLYAPGENGHQPAHTGKQTW